MDAEVEANVALVAELSMFVQELNRQYLRDTHPGATEREVDRLLELHILRTHDNEFSNSEYRRVPGWPRQR